MEICFSHDVTQMNFLAHYVNVSLFIKFSQKTRVFTLIIVNSI